MIRTYSIRLILADHGFEPSMRILQMWKLFGIQGRGLSNQTNTVEWQIGVVSLGQLALGIQGLVQVLTNTRVRTISTDKNVALVLRVI